MSSALCSLCIDGYYYATENRSDCCVTTLHRCEHDCHAPPPTKGTPEQ